MRTATPTLAGSPALESPKKRGWPVPLLGGGGSAATAFRAIVYTSAREALTEACRDEGWGQRNEGVRTEKDGTESSSSASARVPSSQLEGDRGFSTGKPLASHHRVDKRWSRISPQHVLSPERLGVIRPCDTSVVPKRRPLRKENDILTYE